jgi:hypothetical protein
MRSLVLVAAASALMAASCSGGGSPPGGSGGRLGGTGGVSGMGGGAGATGSGGRGSGGVETAGSGGAAGGAGSGGAPAGSGGSGSGGAGAGGATGRSDAGAVDATSAGDAGVGPGTPSLCAGSPFAVCQDFEATAVGATPAGNWGVPTTNYGSGASLAVAADDSARGSHSLKVTIPASGNSFEQYLQLKNLGALSSGHYGRIFVKIGSPTTSLFVHWDLILGAGQYSGSAVRVRWGNTGTGVGATNSNWSWIYNVEQGDFGTEARTTHPVLGQWMCVEWQWDGTNQQARFYFQGTEVQALHIDTTLPGGTQSPELPIFTSLSFGLAKYQNTDNPLVFWIDEIALDTQRIGCGR